MEHVDGMSRERNVHLHKGWFNETLPAFLRRLPKEDDGADRPYVPQDMRSNYRQHFVRHSVLVYSWRVVDVHDCINACQGGASTHGLQSVHVHINRTAVFAAALGAR